MLFFIHKVKLLQLFSIHPIDQQCSPCCHNYLTFTQSYQCKVNPIVALHAEKIADLVLLYGFKIAFEVSLLTNHCVPFMHKELSDEISLLNAPQYSEHSKLCSPIIRTQSS